MSEYSPFNDDWKRKIFLAKIVIDYRPTSDFVLDTNGVAILIELLSQKGVGALYDLGFSTRIESIKEEK